MEKKKKRIVNELNNLLFEGLAVHIYWKDASFRYIYCNPLQAKNVGFRDPNDIIGKTDYDIFPSEIANIFRQNDQKVLKSGTPHIFEEPCIHGEQRVVFLTQKIPIIKNDKVVGIAGISFDISERKDQEEKLRFAQQNAEYTLYEILDNLPGHVYWKDTDGVFLGCNKAQVKSAGYKTKGEIIGKTDYELPWKANVKQIMNSDQYVISNKKTITREEEAQIEGEKEASVFLSKKAPLFNALGEVIGVLGISFDITDRKKLEENLKEAKQSAEAANQVKSEFIANMSHDLRTPLTGILGLIQELIDLADETQTSLRQSDKDQPLNNLQQDLIKMVQEDGQLLLNSADELLQLLNEILETMRLESGTVHEKTESFNLRELILHNLELMQPVARHRQIELVSEFNEDLPVFVSGYRSYLDRTLLNLLSNALKFTEKGFVKLSVEWAKEKKSYRTADPFELKITVQDTGIGIPEDKFGTIFEHFSRLTPSYQGLYKGAGLGLYTVKRYIEAMQAEIKVESEVGKGTRFIINLPLIVSDHSDREKISYQRSKPKEIKAIESAKKMDSIKLAKEDANLSILIVEDNLLAAKAVQANVKYLDDCYCEVAENGKAAIKKVQEQDYDLVLMDIGLPDLDGIEVTRQIRALNHNIRKVPIVALTGHGSDVEIEEKALKAGMQEVFTKPLQMTKLEAALERYVYPLKQKVRSLELTQQQDEIIDWEACLLNMGGDEEFVRELLSILSEDLKITQEKLERAYAAQDTKALGEELHKARGGVVYLVLPELDKSLAQFHAAVKAKPQNELEMQQSYEQLQNAIAHFWEACSELTKPLHH